MDERDAVSDQRPPTLRRPMDHIDAETIAVWLDTPEDLTPEERAAIEQHLLSCEECQQVADELRVIVAAMSNLPDIALPRSFSLSGDLARQGPAGAREPTLLVPVSRWHERQIRALRWATAAAAVLFVLVLGVDLVTTRIDRPVTGDLAATTSAESAGVAGGAAPAEVTEETMAAKAGSQATPVASPAADVAAAEAQSVSTEPTNGRESATLHTAPPREAQLRAIEFGLVTIFVVLLGLMIALPRLRQRRWNRS